MAEDLGPYSQDELAVRIALLEAAHRNAAEAVFGRKE